MGWINSFLQNHPLLQQTIQILHTHRLEAYLVGGAVRDMLLGREQIVDLDFAVPGDGLAVARRVANGLSAAFYPLDTERGTGRVVLDKTYLDFASFRGATLLEDLTDRDFTLNAIAIRLAEPFELIDPLGGQQDLKLGQIRAASPTAFSHDPVRVVRAVRQAVEFGFTLEPTTETLLRAAVPGLSGISPERQRDEMLKLLNTPAPGQAVQLLRRLEVLPHLLPEVEPMISVRQGPPHHLDVFDHTTTALDAWAGMVRGGLADLPESLQAPAQAELSAPLAGNLSQQMLLPLALLLHDTGKPATRSPDPDSPAVHFYGHEQISAEIARRVMQRFHFSNQAADFVETVVAQHMRPLLLTTADKVSRRAVYRFFRDTAGSGYQAGMAVALHALADQRATYPPNTGQAELQELREVVYKLGTAYFEQREQVVEPPPLLTGRDLIETLGLAEGRLIGVLLNRLKEAQATGDVTDRAEAVAFIQADPDFQSDRRPPLLKAGH